MLGLDEGILLTGCVFLAIASWLLGGSLALLTYLGVLFIIIGCVSAYVRKNDEA